MHLTGTELKNLELVKAGKVVRRYTIAGNTISGAHATTIRRLEGKRLVMDDPKTPGNASRVPIVLTEKGKQEVPH